MPTKGSEKKLAQKYCSNWVRGNCIGRIIKYEDGMTKIWLDEELADKECIIDAGCYFFEDYVRPALK
tara:strand:- start:486 stop:686 length:201 start_codon:yes stop_codon:yes gene_type:complete